MDTSPPASPPSASNSVNSAANPFSLTLHNPQVDVVATTNGVADVQEKKSDIINVFMDFDSTEDNDKYMKYEADYARRLMAKYFSKKDLYGGNIFDKKVTIDGQTIKSSRWPSTRSYADPVQGFEDHSSSSSTSTEETLSHVSNGKHISKRSG